MPNAFQSYLNAKQAAMTQGANALAMAQVTEKIQRDRQLRDILAGAYTAPTPEVPMAGPTPTGEPMAPIPAQAGGMDWERAMGGAAEGGVIPEMMQMQAGMAKARGTAPSSIREWQAYQQMSPADQKKFLSMKRASQFQTIGGVVTQVGGGQPPKPLSTLDEEAAAQARITAEKTAAKKAAEVKSKLLGLEPKARMTAQIVKKQAALVNNAIDKAIGQISPFTAGPGAMAAGLPGTPAKNLKETLNTIRANIGFDRLQQMRASSPTGGALGQVSEMENKLLQSVMGSLDQSQSPSQLKENLRIAKKSIRESWERIAAAYEQDYGKPMPMEGGAAQAVPEGQVKKVGGKTYIKQGGKWFVQ